jgi:hypothetical protein
LGENGKYLKSICTILNSDEVREKDCYDFNEKMQKYIITSSHTQNQLFKYAQKHLMKITGKFLIEGKKDLRGLWSGPINREPIFKNLKFRKGMSTSKVCNSLILTVEKDFVGIDCMLRKKVDYMICEYNMNDFVTDQ